MNNAQEIYHHTQLPVSPDSVIMRSVTKKTPLNDKEFAQKFSSFKSSADGSPEMMIVSEIKEEVVDMDGTAAAITSSEETNMIG